MAKRKHYLPLGVVLKPYGVNSRIDNDNITDSMVALFIKNKKASKNDFITEEEYLKQVSDKERKEKLQNKK